MHTAHVARTVMIFATANSDGPAFTFNASLGGLAIYLDTFAIINLAKGDPSRRKRFVSALVRKGDLLFSVSNAADLSGPQGDSQSAVRLFLDEIGPHWFPVELDPFEVVSREKALEKPFESCLCKRFLKDYFASRVANSSGLVNLSGEFFSLGAVLDWVGPQRSSIAAGLAELDRALIGRISEYRIRFEKDPQWLESSFPELPFNPLMPATFTYVNLVRSLILQAKAFRFKKGDGLDFCHAVMAISFASVAALDKQWKRRAESIPKPNTLAPIYYQPELDRMVADIESCNVTRAPHPLDHGALRPT
jgi:hypothetical protein